jgi:glucose/arabinose dehydrogenase
VRVLLITVATTAALVIAAGCGAADNAAPPVETSRSSSSTPPSPTDTPSATSTPPDLVPITVTVSGGQVEPPPGRVDVPQGHTVLITVTSDEEDELHVHGYDIEVELAPGQPGTVEFVADQAGLFEVETHDQGLQLFQLVVQ